VLASNPLSEISIKVPAPFAGVADLGFTAQYHPQDYFAPLRDVPLVLEGPAAAMERLVSRLQVLAQLQEAHSWSGPIALSDEVAVIAFRDRSLEGRSLADGARASLDYVLNLVRPVVFPFLQDCAQVARLRLADRIELRIQAPPRQIAELQLRLDEIVRPNGDRLL
jgi:hypothetical protein